MNEHEVNKFWKKIVDTINDGLMFIGPEGSILMVNKAFESLTGYTQEESIGMSCKKLRCDACELIIQKSRDDAWCMMFEEGRQDIKKCRCHVRKKDGDFIPILKNAAVLRDEKNEILGIVETLTDISELTKLDEKVQILSRQCEAENDFFGMVGKSKEMQMVFSMVEKAAQSSAPVIIHGESGTGKELVANAIHLCGARKDKPFIQLNCAALNEAMLESELFGHVKGSFTGAYNNRIGRFEAANHGDFFLDEIGDMPLSLQTKLLRVLESGRFERVGDISPIDVDVRIITATNKNLEKLVRSNEFRQDLYFRINVIPITIPPLRKRKSDILLLINSAIRRLNKTTEKSITGVSQAALDQLITYIWPGNVRELKNTMEYAFVACDENNIQSHHLPKRITDPEPLENEGAPAETSIAILDEKHQLIQVLQATGGNQTEAARHLNVSRVTIWNRIKKYGINVKDL
jgi:two-component system response regulator HydG